MSDSYDIYYSVYYRKVKNLALGNDYMKIANQSASSLSKINKYKLPFVNAPNIPRMNTTEISQVRH